MANLSQQLFELLKTSPSCSVQEVLHLIAQGAQLDESVFVETQTMSLASYMVRYMPEMLSAVLASDHSFNSHTLSRGLYTAIEIQKADLAMQIINKITPTLGQLSAMDKTNLLLFSITQNAANLFLYLLNCAADVNDVIEIPEHTILSYLIKTKNHPFIEVALSHPTFKFSSYILIALKEAILGNEFFIFQSILNKYDNHAKNKISINTSCSINTYNNLLKIATQLTAIPFIELLINNGADPYRLDILLSLVENQQTGAALAIINSDGFLFEEAALEILLKALATDQFVIAHALLQRHDPEYICLDTATLNNFTALEIAQQKNNPEMVTLLEEHGARPNQIPKVLPPNGFKNTSQLLQDVLENPAQFSEILGLWLVGHGAQCKKSLALAIYAKRARLISAIIESEPERSSDIDWTLITHTTIATKDPAFIKHIFYNLLPRNHSNFYIKKLTDNFGMPNTQEILYGNLQNVNLSAPLRAPNWDQGRPASEPDFPNTHFEIVNNTIIFSNHSVGPK